MALPLAKSICHVTLWNVDWCALRLGSLFREDGRPGSLMKLSSGLAPVGVWAPHTQSSLPQQDVEQNRKSKIFSLHFIAEHDVTWHEISFGSVWASCPGCLLPVCCACALLTGGAELEKERALMLSEQHPKHGSSHKFLRLQHMGYCGEN